jgi:hypothetical protein
MNPAKQLFIHRADGYLLVVAHPYLLGFKKSQALKKLIERVMYVGGFVL